jgi:hypothetical protein
VFTGTPTFFDDRHGVKGVEALYARIKYEEFNGVPSLRQPQLALKPFDRERLLKVAFKIRSLHPDLAPDEAERRLPRELIEQLVDQVTEGFRGDVGVVPRQFLRTFVNVLDVLADDPDRNAHDLLGFEPTDSTDEERAILAGRSARVPPEQVSARAARQMANGDGRRLLAGFRRNGSVFGMVGLRDPATISYAWRECRSLPISS